MAKFVDTVAAFVLEPVGSAEQQGGAGPQLVDAITAHHAPISHSANFNMIYDSRILHSWTTGSYSSHSHTNFVCSCFIEWFTVKQRSQIDEHQRVRQKYVEQGNYRGVADMPGWHSWEGKCLRASAIYVGDNSSYARENIREQRWCTAVWRG